MWEGCGRVVGGLWRGCVRVVERVWESCGGVGGLWGELRDCGEGSGRVVRGLREGCERDLREKSNWDAPPRPGRHPARTAGHRRASSRSPRVRGAGGCNRCLARTARHRFWDAPPRPRRWPARTAGHRRASNDSPRVRGRWGGRNRWPARTAGHRCTNENYTDREGGGRGCEQQ